MSGLGERPLAVLGEVVDEGVGASDVARVALTISKGYVEGKWALHLHVRLRGPGVEPKRHEFFAVFSRCSSHEMLVDVDAKRPGVTEANRINEVGRFGQHVSLVDGAVLVLVPDLVDEEERVVSCRLPALVRLGVLDQCPYVPVGGMPSRRPSLFFCAKASPRNSAGERQIGKA